MYSQQPKRQSCGYSTCFAANLSSTCKRPRALGDLPRGAVQLPLAAVAERVLTLKQMREMVEELYASKAKHDAKCADAGLPRETLEQHVYTALNTKYGLRPLIAEYVSACFDGIRRHAAADNDVATFGCIVRSEVDEEFRLVHSAQFIRRNSARN